MLRPDTLTADQLLHTQVLTSGHFQAALASAEDLAYAVAPPDLFNNWIQHPLDEVVEGGIDLLPNEEGSTSLDCWTSATSEHYKYMNLPPHARRLRMVTDFVLYAAQNALEHEQRVTILDMGAGSLALESLLRKRLSTMPERNRIDLAAADINPMVTRKGIDKGLIDRGAQWDWSEQSVSDIIHKVGGNVVVFAEVLEHMQHVIGTFAQDNLRQARETYGISTVGTVPNAIQLSEIIGYLQGTRAPHQLVKAMRLPDFDHVSHFTYPSLGESLTTAGYLPDQIYIASNGIQLSKQRTEFSYPDGLHYPHLGHRLIFLAQNQPMPKS